MIKSAYIGLKRRLPVSSNEEKALNNETI
jgi:hypothetical protein